MEFVMPSANFKLQIENRDFDVFATILVRRLIRSDVICVHKLELSAKAAWTKLIILKLTKEGCRLAKVQQIKPSLSPADDDRDRRPFHSNKIHRKKKRWKYRTCE